MIKRDNLYYDSRHIVDKLHFATDENNDHYRVGPEGTTVMEGAPLIAWTTAVFIGDTRQIWLRGQLWNVDSASSYQDILARIDAKQPALVSGTTIKTINGQSLLGSGDIRILRPSFSFELNLSDGCLYATEHLVFD